MTSITPEYKDGRGHNATYLFYLETMQNLAKVTKKGQNR